MGVRWHVMFGVLLAAAVALRMVGLAGYSSVLWTGDSVVYLKSAMTLAPSPNRPSGYGLLLWALRPFHSFTAVAVVQATLGVLTGVMVYALVWRTARRAWLRNGWLAAALATVASAPVLLDGNLLQLEHLLVSDTLFGFLVAAALTMLLWSPRPALWQYGLAGSLLGCAAATRMAGIPLVLVMLAAMAVRGHPAARTAATMEAAPRVSLQLSPPDSATAAPPPATETTARFAAWRRWSVEAIVLAGMCAVPVIAHMTWSHAHHGEFSISKHSGVWLYGRTTSFADCAKITAKDPALAVLCPKWPPTDPRVTSPAYAAMFTTDSPFRRVPGGIYGPHSNELAHRFATTAITTQPLDYLKTVISDTLKAFKPERSPYPTTWTEAKLHFPKKASRALNSPAAAGQRALAYSYGGATAHAHLTDPYARWIRYYQADWHLPGPALALLLAIGLAGAGIRILRRSWEAARAILLPWLTATALLVIPAATADFDYRYLLPAIAPACLAAALAFVPGTAPTSRSRRTSSDAAQPATQNSG